MRRTIVVGLIAALAGCSGPPPNAAQVAMASPQQDAAGKRFDPPPPGLAAVYFFDPTSLGPGINVFVDQRRVGRIGPQTWMRIELGPGSRVVNCLAVDASNRLSLNIAPGEMRFIDVQMPPGQPVCTMHEVGSEQGRSAVLQSGRALQPR